MKVFLLIVALAAGVQLLHAQTKYFTKEGKVSFYSKAPMENIEAHNTKGVSIFDLSTGQIEFSVLLKGFEFEKAKMQEHFNENYVESDTYPKAVFAGTIKNLPALSKNGVYNVPISGNLTLHGVTKPQNAQAVFTVINGSISAVSDFTIQVADYNIKIPSLVAEKVSNTVKIVISVPSYQPLPARS